MSQTWLTVRVVGRSMTARGIVALDLATFDGHPLPSFGAGAHIDVEAAPNLVRQYSLCNAPSVQDRYQIAVLAAPDSRGGSLAMQGLAIGDRLRIGPPRNHFALAPDAVHSILIAGGVGVTPLLAMAHELAGAGASFELHYCARSPEHAAFRDLLATAAFADRVVFHFDDGPAEQRLTVDTVLADPGPGRHAYVCGPAGFMEHVLEQARRRDWPDERLHREFFSLAVSKPPADGERGFDVRLARSGVTVHVPPDRSIIEALDAAGIEVLASCEQGVCGTCLTAVLEGEVDHRDSFLTPAERKANDQLTPCCSRALGPVLVLDL